LGLKILGLITSQLIGVINGPFMEPFQNWVSPFGQLGVPPSLGVRRSTKAGRERGFLYEPPLKGLLGGFSPFLIEGGKRSGPGVKPPFFPLRKNPGGRKKNTRGKPMGRKNLCATQRSRVF